MISSTAVQAERIALSWQWEYFEPFGVQFQVKVQQESRSPVGKGGIAMRTCILRRWRVLF
jgi:hypothetical protein